MGAGSLVVASGHLQHLSPATQAFWCALAAISVGGAGWRLYVQIQVDREWLRRLRGGRPGRLARSG